MESTRGQLGKYTLIAEIARGGMGIIYLAHTSAMKLVVIKQLKPDLAEDEKYRGMFLDEAKLGSRLHHRNIVQTIEVGEAEDGRRFFFVMEYLEGRTLERVMKMKGEQALSVPTMLRVACDVLAGLHYAHEVNDADGAPLGLVHRDVSPHNVFLTYDGQVKLLDFGVAKAFGRAQITDPGLLRGRVTCMSPDHVGDDPLDRRADVFAVGVLLREALTGKTVWGERSEVEILRELMAKRIPPLPAYDGLAPELRTIVEKAMAPQRDDRYRTAHAMRAALEQYVIRVDPAGSLVKMGQAISKEFTEYRMREKEIIELQISRNRQASASSSDVPVLPNASLAPPAPAAQPGPSDSTPPSAIPIAPQMSVLTPGVEARPTMPVPPQASLVTSSLTSKVPPPPPSPTGIEPPPLSGGPVSGGPRSTSGATAPVSNVAPQPRRPNMVVLVVAMAVVAISLGGGAAVFRRSVRAAASAASSASAAIASAPGTPAGEPVVLAVEASPASAQIVVDDVVTTGNPWRATFARGTTHTIRVVAAGFAPQTETVTLKGATILNIALEIPETVEVDDPPRAGGPAPQQPPTRPRVRWSVAKPAAPTPPRESAAAPSPPTAPAAASTPAGSADPFGGGKPPQRSIDSDTPYK